MSTWQDYNELTRVLYITEEAPTQHRVWVTDFDGKVIETLPVLDFTVDDCCFDYKSMTYWTTNEGTGEVANIYEFDSSGKLRQTIQIALANIMELESVCVAADGSLWATEDKTDNSKLMHYERVPDGSGDGIQIGSTIDLAAKWSMVNSLSLQGLTYDYKTDTLWGANNLDNTIYNFELDGTLLTSIDVDSIVVTPAVLQGLTVDPYTDTIYFAARKAKVYQINKAGVLLDTIEVEGLTNNGPTGVTLGYHARDYTGPRNNWKMDEDAADTVVQDLTQRFPGTLNDNTADVHVAGHFGDGAFDMSGNKFIDLGADVEIIQDHRTFTMSAWIYLDNLTERQYFFNSDDDGAYFRIDRDVSGRDVTLDFGTQGEFNYTPYNDSANYWTTGEWQHIFITKGSDFHVRVYRNNVDPDNVGAASITDNMEIRYLCNRTTDFFDGKMQQLMIFDRELTADERAFIYNNGAGTNDVWELTGNAPLLSGGGPRARYNG